MLREFVIVICAVILLSLLGCDGGCENGEPIDSDNDGIIDSEDNCPLAANADQLESKTLCDAVFFVQPTE